MNKWLNIQGYDTSAISEIRKEFHKAVQLIGAFPRNFLPPDPSDVSASLIWNTERFSLESNLVKDIRIGLSHIDFSINIHREDELFSKFILYDQSVNSGLLWLQAQLNQLGFKWRKS